MKSLIFRIRRVQTALTVLPVIIFIVSLKVKKRSNSFIIFASLVVYNDYYYRWATVGSFWSNPVSGRENRLDTLMNSVYRIPGTTYLPDTLWSLFLAEYTVYTLKDPLRYKGLLYVRLFWIVYLEKDKSFIEWTFIQMTD